jgi:hypothetical protein
MTDRTGVNVTGPVPSADESLYFDNYEMPVLDFYGVNATVTGRGGAVGVAAGFRNLW